MNIGLYFGSFNPIHIGHLIIANHVVSNTNLKQLWFVVSPQNPSKPSSVLLNEYHRLHLVKKAIEDNNKFKASDIEFKLPKPSYTIDTLTHLKEKYPIHNFTVIMGSDSFTNLKNWKNYQLILRDYDIVIYKRPGFEIDNNLNDRITILNAPLLEISATAIRENIKEGKSIQYLVCDAVNTEISNNGYYK